jgi:hypothetical protein
MTPLSAGHLAGGAVALSFAALRRLLAQPAKINPSKTWRESAPFLPGIDQQKNARRAGSPL